jgi:hypothetical protein
MVTADQAGFRVLNTFNTGIEGVTSRENTSGVRGTSGISSGGGTGVLGECQSSTGGIGVWGIGYTGVTGQSSNASGFGVYGESPNYGILGKATNTTNYNYGVRGESGSVQGVGVYGEASSATGPTVGIIGRAVSSEGKGILGYGYSSSGTNYGVYGYSNSPSGYGIYGYSPNFGIYGEATAANNSANSGVTGKSVSAYGHGVHGIASSNTGANYGVYGESYSTTGYGVHGSGPGTGVKGYATASDGKGVVGVATATTGTTVGIFGQVNSANGFSGYFTGGKFYVTGRTGIGTVVPSAGLHLKGSGFPESFMYLEANTGSDAGFRLYEGTADKWHIFNNAIAGGLQIYNSAGQTAFFAKQSNSYVGIGTTTPAFTLEVNGTAGKTGGGSWSTSSDIRLKNLTGSYNKGLNEINALQPVLFTYKPGNARHLPADTQQIGFVAQEVQKIFPETVTMASDGYLDFNIHSINVAMVNAIKELKAENDRLKAENELLKQNDCKQNERLEKLEKMFSVSVSENH